jgi:hypothetical protein
VEGDLQLEQPEKKMNLDQQYGVQYFPCGGREIVESPEGDLYAYRIYFGSHAVDVLKGDCAFTLTPDLLTAEIKRGPAHFQSAHIATVLRGYAPENKSSTIRYGTNLPYVNGCSTRQIFPPERPGDPTFQLLEIPPYSSEQGHHIHSTARVVFVLAGSGHSIVGMPGHFKRTRLSRGMLCILNKMCPHHFETEGEKLVVLPIHIWSSTGSQEFVHPMFDGTFMLSNGRSR